MSMKWINSAGGPFILMGEELIRDWRGILPAPVMTGVPEDTDYDLACAVRGYAGTVIVSGGVALVLNDEPMRTTWLPSDGGDGGIFVRWQYADSEDELLRHLHSIPSQAFSKEDFLFPMVSSKALLFDAAIPGVQVGADERLEITATPGSYVVLTAEYRPNDRTAMVLNRLLKVG